MLEWKIAREHPEEVVDLVFHEIMPDNMEFGLLSRERSYWKSCLKNIVNNVKNIVKNIWKIV